MYGVCDSGIGWGVGWIGDLGVLLALGAGVVVLTWGRVTRKLSSGRLVSSDPLEILRQRLASGEISQQEYEQAQRALA